MAKSQKASIKTPDLKELLSGKLWPYLLQRARFGGFSAYAPGSATTSKTKVKKKRPAIQLALASYVSVNCVIFGYDSRELKVLLLESNPESSGKSSNHKSSKISLPGDLVQKHENLDESARRISRGSTGMEQIFLEQLITHGYPGGNKSVNHKAGYGAHVINIAYFAIINLDDYNERPVINDNRLNWYSLNKIPKLAHNHAQVLQKALETLRFKLKYFPLAFELLPEKFTLGQVQTLYEAISGKKYDKRNFRKKLSGQKFLVQSEEKETGVSHKPAFYYRFDHKIYTHQYADVFEGALF
jgi:8-oxo-dGTP diphosphatase